MPAKPQHNLADTVMPSKKIAKTSDVTQKIVQGFNTADKAGMRTMRTMRTTVKKSRKK